MSENDTQPAETGRPKRQITIRPVHFGLAAVLAVMVFIVVGWASSGPDGDPATTPTPASLCQLLREGWNASDLASNDVWRTWPESQSPDSRAADIVLAADRGGCFHLV